MGNLQFVVAIISFGQTVGFTELGPLEAECFVCAVEFGRLLSLPWCRGSGFRLGSATKRVCITDESHQGKPELLEFISLALRFGYIADSIVSTPDGTLGENPIRAPKFATFNSARSAFP